MKDINFNDHPIALLPRWVSALSGDDWRASFSRYRYIPQTVEDKRTRFSIPLSAVSIQWLENELSTLGENDELAMDSVLKQGSKILHIPMIDFAIPLTHKFKALEWASNYTEFNFQFFETGRSLHAYGTHLITPRRWIQLMGHLLLANLPNQPPIVDTRWIGHRLTAGYSSLRWSKNSHRYLSFPTLLN